MKLDISFESLTNIRLRITVENFKYDSETSEAQSDDLFIGQVSVWWQKSWSFPIGCLALLFFSFRGHILLV